MDMNIVIAGDLWKKQNKKTTNQNPNFEEEIEYLKNPKPV